MKKQNVRTLSFIVSSFTYLLIGAAIFDALESQTEENIKTELERLELDYKYRYNISSDEYKYLEDIVNKYHPYKTFPQWKFTGAFYFSLTVITTIGYGHSTPQTIPGKMFCMFYAIVGIPLCLVMFQSVGERLNHFASFCIQLFKKCLRFKNSEVNQTEMVCVAGIFVVVVITGGAAMFSYYEGWSYLNSIYYCVITLTTIGFGDFVALQDRNDLSNITYVIFSFTFILFGLTVVASSINLVVLKFLTMNTDDERREEYTRKIQNKSPHEINMSNSDLLNVINGNVLCAFEPTDLNDLKRENSLSFCFSSLSGPAAGHSAIENNLRTRARARALAIGRYNLSLDGKFPFIKFELAPPAESTAVYRAATGSHQSTDRLDYDANQTKLLLVTNKVNSAASNLSESLVPPSSSDDSKTRQPAPNLFRPQKSCPSCINNMKLTNALAKKKTHYTVTRGPGKISHLLLTNRLNSFDANRPDTGEVGKPRLPNPITTHSCPNNAMFSQRDDQSIRRFSSKRTSSSSAQQQIAQNNININNNNNNLTFDINIYIDDEDESYDEDREEDCFTATNATTVSNLTNTNNNTKSTEENCFINKHNNYLDVKLANDNHNTSNSKLSTNNTDLSSQTDYETIEEGEFFFKPICAKQDTTNNNNIIHAAVAPPPANTTDNRCRQRHHHQHQHKHKHKHKQHKKGNVDNRSLNDSDCEFEKSYDEMANVV